MGEGQPARREAYSRKYTRWQAATETSDLCSQTHRPVLSILKLSAASTRRLSPPASVQLNMSPSVDEPETSSVPSTANGYPQTKLNSIRIYKHRARYDYETVHSIFNSTLVSHVSFITNDEEGYAVPVNFPLTAALGRYDTENANNHDAMTDEELRLYQQEAMSRFPMEVYLHGNASSLIYKAIKASALGTLRVCITSSKVDGIVLFPTPNGHSLNYRSATIHGLASLVPNQDTAKKRWAMRLLTNHMIKGRWDATHPVASSAMKHEQVIEVQVLTASAKVRAQNIGTFDAEAVIEETGREWMSKGVWSGVVPFYKVLGKPVSSSVTGERGESSDALRLVEEWRTGVNKSSKEYAEAAAVAGEEERTMRGKVQHGSRRYLKEDQPG